MLKNSGYRRQVPVNIGSFAELVKRDGDEHYYVFIDKTGVIPLLVPERSLPETRQDPGQSMLIIRPRRWGKTLFMSMLEAFFSNTTQGGKLFRGLAIESLEGGRYMVEQGQYPVISLSLRDVSEKSFESFLIKIDLAFKSLYDRYKALLLSSLNLDEDDKNEVRLMTCARSSSADVRGKEALENSLKELSRLLFKHFNQTVFILIDEYDTPLNGVYKNAQLVEEISDFMKNMLGAALKDNDYLRKGIMTGILRLSQSNMLSQLNNLKVYTSRSDQHFSPYFGFTEAEVIGLMERMGNAQHGLDAVKSFYNGYYLEGRTIYNPWAINNYLHSGQLKPYWVNSGNDNLLLELLKEVPLRLKQVLENLLAGKSSSVIVDTEDRVQFSELKKNEAAFLGFLLSTGYLTITPEEVVSQSRSLAGDRYCVRIPNEEIHHRFCILFAQIMRENFKLTDEENTHFIDMLFDNKTDAFANQLRIYLSNCASYHDFPRESNYHTFMLGLVAHLRNDYFILSNTEAGDGRADLIFIPKALNKSEALIIELKHVKNEKLFQYEAKKAIQQINDQNYAARLIDYVHIDSVHCIGIAFYKKQSHVLAGKTFEIAELFPGSRKKRSLSLFEDKDVPNIEASELQSTNEGGALPKKKKRDSLQPEKIKAKTRFESESRTAALHSQRIIDKVMLNRELNSSITVEVPPNGDCGFTAAEYALRILGNDALAIKATRAGFINTVTRIILELRASGDTPRSLKLRELLEPIYQHAHLDFNLHEENLIAWQRHFNRSSEWVNDIHFALMSYEYGLRFEFYVINHENNTHLHPRGGSLGEGSVIDHCLTHPITVRLMSNAAGIVNESAIDPNNHFDLLYFTPEERLLLAIRNKGYKITQDIPTHNNTQETSTLRHAVMFTAPLSHSSLNQNNSSKGPTTDYR